MGKNNAKFDTPSATKLKVINVLEDLDEAIVLVKRYITEGNQWAGCRVCGGYTRTLFPHKCKPTCKAGKLVHKYRT